MPRKTNSAPGSLAGLLADILAATQVPVATTPMRIITSIMRGEEVTAERLSRVASAERESFLRSHRPPRLCQAINPDGISPRRRIWASGDWRTARRIITADSQAVWHAQAGLFVCGLVLDHNLDDDRLSPLAHELGAQALGPLGAWAPSSRSEWVDMRDALLQVPDGPGPATHTVEQTEAEKSLEASGLTGLTLYFGLQGPAGLQRRRRPAELRLALPGEPDAVPFDELVEQRAGDRAKAREILSYVEAFGRLSDELGGPPSASQFAERWKATPSEVAEARDAFVALFPGEDDPTRILMMLWQGLGRGPGVFGRLLGVAVVVGRGSPSVIGSFLAAVADEARDEEGTRAAREAMKFNETPFDPARELRCFYALCERAVDVWCAEVLAARDDEASLAGLRSLESVREEETAAFTQGMLGEYRMAEPEGIGRRVLLATQKALRIAASLRMLDPPGSTTPYIDGIRWAAKALVAARAELGTNLTAEAKITAERLDAVI